MSKQYIFTRTPANINDFDSDEIKKIKTKAKEAIKKTHKLAGVTFTDGKATLNEVDGLAIQNILINFYLCKLDIVEVVDSTESTLNNLSKSETTKEVVKEVGKEEVKVEPKK